MSTSTGMWWEWQTRNPTGVPYDLDSVLSPWSYTIRDMLDISRFGYEYVRCSFFMPVGHGSADRPLRLEADQDRSEGSRTSARPKSACIGCRNWCARASCGPFSTSRARMRRRPCATTRITPAIWRSSAMANATAAPAIANCRRRGRGRSTSGRATTIRRATIALMSPPPLGGCLRDRRRTADHAAGDRRRLSRGA